MPSQHPRRTELHLLRADALIAAHSADAALAEARAALEGAEHAITPISLTIARAWSAVARAELVRGDRSAAQAALHEARTHVEAAPGKDQRLIGELDELERSVRAPQR